MPTLPTLTVTQAQADRMLAAWGDTESYKVWLKEQIIKYVIEWEKTLKQRQFLIELEQDEQETRQTLE